jgi:hypothetical protein
MNVATYRVDPVASGNHWLGGPVPEQFRAKPCTTSYLLSHTPDRSRLMRISGDSEATSPDTGPVAGGTRVRL